MEAQTSVQILEQRGDGAEVQVQKHNLEQHIEWKVTYRMEGHCKGEGVFPRTILDMDERKVTQFSCGGIRFSDSEYLSHCLKACAHNIQYNIL